MNDKPEQLFRQIGLFVVIIGDLVGFTGLGVFLGYVAWKKWGAPGWVLLITTTTGLVLACFRMYRIARKLG